MRPLVILVLLVVACEDPPPPSPPSSAAPSARPTATGGTVGAPRGPRLSRVSLPGAAERGAVCSDGSPAVIYLREGLPDHRDDWVLHLEGGARCESVEGCRARAREAPDAMTSKRAPPARAGSGILDADPLRNPAFHGFTHVLVPHCSADGFLGDRVAEGWHFRGRRILEAVVSSLKIDRERGPSLARARLVLLTGSGTGGEGVVHHLDGVAAALPGVTVRGVSDGAFVAPGPGAAAFWGVRADDCAEDCADATKALARVKTPLFLRIDLRDPFGRQADGQERAREDPRAIGEVRALLSSRSAAFGPSSGRATALTDAAFHEEAVDGERFAEVLARWVLGRPGPTKVVAEAR